MTFERKGFRIVAPTQEAPNLKTGEMETVSITVGTPATIFVGSDRYAAKVTRISESGITVYVKREGSAEEEKVRKVPGKGEWRLTGSLGTRPNWSVYFGAAENYRDPDL